jgi:hypothetical protein
MKKATHEGEMIIGEKSIKCAVLEDGTRILTQSGVYIAFDRPRRGRRKKDPVFELNGKRIPIPSFLSGTNLMPYLNEAILDGILPIEYITKSGKKSEGYKADILPVLAEIWLKAREDGVRLNHRQVEVAKKAEILVRSLAKVGITALIDEATGYQEIRDRKALQVILDKYLTDEWSKWTKTFPDEYYRELFRLKGIDYPPKNGKKCSYVGHWTNDVVYSRLAPGILDELRKKNPVTKSGIRARRHPQHLTEDFGNPKLKEYLSQIIFLMKTCSSFREFDARLARVAPKYNETIPIDFKE